jgi:CheY-like chemotaxis protein
MQPLRILLVEDDPVFQKIIAHFAGNNGFDLKTTDTGNEALTLLNQFPFDLILLDVEMPGRDGYQTLEMIRQSFVNFPIPIIMISGNGKPIQQETLLDGASSFLRKPFTEKQLLNEIEKLALKF